jgi:hypothetical protein
VAAHPDDVDFGAAPTVASWTMAGVRVGYCLCTSGVEDVTFLGYPDGRLTSSIELRRDISNAGLPPGRLAHSFQVVDTA